MFSAPGFLGRKSRKYNQRKIRKELVLYEIMVSGKFSTCYDCSASIYLGILVKCPKNEGSNCFCEKMLFGIKARSN
jgi:hypothetical protein